MYFEQYTKPDSTSVPLLLLSLQGKTGGPDNKLGSYPDLFMPFRVSGVGFGTCRLSGTKLSKKPIQVPYHCLSGRGTHKRSVKQVATSLLKLDKTFVSRSDPGTL